MGMQALLNMLVSCFGRRMTVNGQFVRALKRSLPSDLTAAQGEELGLRLVQRCTFAPTVAEILSEWRTMRGEMRRRAAVTAPAPIGRKTAVPQKVRDIRHFLQQRQPLPKGEAVPALCDFARQFFPDISDDMIQKNWLEIANCMHDRQEEERTGRACRTGMVMEPDGTISLVVQLLSRTG